ncbi:MAG: hypothetical protein MUF29_00555 [Chitinophagaceae bacterium]|jgi:hypothetical protein|nr:hypothetical protein [Chitinophagaceae bacterium]
MSKHAFTRSAGYVLLSILLACSQGHAQNKVGMPAIMTLNDRNVEPGIWEKVVEGTPFYNPEWRPASLLLANGTLVENLPVRVNLLENLIHYLDTAGREMVTMLEVKSVIFLDEGNDTSAVLVNRLALENVSAVPDGWMQLLAKGKAILLKRFVKQDVESKGYSASTVVTRINTIVQYLLLFNGRAERVQTMGDLAGLLENADFSAWVAQQQGSKKSEQQLKAAVDYFNSL